ncbi:MAG: hydroxymethylglutaryl-CoA reductase (NADPH) [Candidatus Methanoplasma sp.]|jgi:hydroxymethylglutaryl-CoA reductase (NADPH)|nr:hydroxymethylglutaryl-CoA reductase (NADPH) [Candidatus Methanoplasma sp.]
MEEKRGLKNRGYTHADVDERRKAVEEFTGTNLESISKYCFDSEKASKNVENMIGATQMPLGFAGPMTINGDHAKGEFLVPLATTEGALIASISRGMSVINGGGGARVKVFQDGMTRAPVFRTNGIDHCKEVIDWIEGNRDLLSSVVGKTTSHGKLTSIESYPAGRNLFTRLTYSTGDAMGMNMATIATEAVCKEIEEHTGAIMVSVSGNMCSDKKAAAINMIKGRGKTVIAEATIPKDIVEKRLHASTGSIVETSIRKNLIGSSLSVTLGANAHAANMIAALYIATGQDPAQVVSGSMTTTMCEDIDGDLYIAVRMPSVEVGTVGGGTRLPSQSEALAMIGCLGDGKASKLAEIVAATVLAGELSTISAQAAGHLGKAHQELGR